MMFTMVFSEFRVTQCLVFCVVYCRSLFVLYLGHCIVCPSSFTVSDYHFDIFKLFLQLACICLTLNIEDTAIKTCYVYLPT